MFKKKRSSDSSSLRIQTSGSSLLAFTSGASSKEGRDSAKASVDNYEWINTKLSKWWTWAGLQFKRLGCQCLCFNPNKTLCERIFGRDHTTGMILWTCLIAAKELSSYLTREDKSFTPLVCWTTQLIQYVPIHNKKCHFVTMFENMHIFNADMLGAKLQHRT